MKIRLLNKQDFQAWKSLRLEALQNAPEAFGSSYEEEVNSSEDNWEAGLKKNDIFGAFIDGSLVATAGFFVMNMIKMKHRGVLFGMYTAPKHRGKGIASSLIEAVVSHAKIRVLQLHLTCVTTNPGAVKLYEKHGFRIYGTEPKSLKIGCKFYDEYLMVLEPDSLSA